MNRRAFLAVLGAAGAGCTGGPGTGGTGRTPSTTDGDTTGTTTTTERTTTTEPTTTRTTVTDPPSVTNPPEIGPFESADEVPCPAVGEQTTCAHTVGDTDAAVYFTPSAAHLERPSDTVTFTLHNESGRQFGMNPYAWTVMQRIPGGWRHVAPSIYPEPWTTVNSGDAFEWSFGFGDIELSGDRMGDTVHLDHLGPGTYAFFVSGLLGEDGERSVTALLPFTVTGDPLALTPGDVTSVERRGDTLVVTTRRGATTDHPATVELSRVEGVENPGTLLTEHAIGVHPIRNGLPYLVDDESLGAVRVATTGAAVSTVEMRLASAFRDPTTDRDGPPAERAYRYAGTTFVTTVDDEPDDTTTGTEKTIQPTPTTRRE